MVGEGRTAVSSRTSGMKASESSPPPKLKLDSSELMLCRLLAVVHNW